MQVILTLKLLFCIQGEMIMNKHTQRMEIRDRIRNLTTDYCRMADSTISNYVLSLPEYQNASYIFCYISVGKETNTRLIIEHAWTAQKRVAVPRCTGKGIMELFEIRSFDDLESGRYGIPEPKTYCSPALSSQIDFAIIPCLSCDRKKNRLGHGGGYYDRYLEHASFTTAALCREMLLLDKVCCEPHDQSVDMLITERGIY